MAVPIVALPTGAIAGGIEWQSCAMRTDYEHMLFPEWFAAALRYR